jgi:MoaA/NifB/PqqE/SkfB family radical SAM enzyme
VNNDTLNSNYPPNRAKKIIDDCAHTHPVYAELSIDNRCNAACLSCSDSFSTMWEEQNKKFNIKTKDDYPDAQNDQVVVEQLFEKFNFDYLKELNFLGGEPLISKTTVLFLQKLIQKNISKNINVLFTTNGSISISQEFKEILEQFKSVNFSFSIDDIEERFQYLRYPLKWNKILNTLESVRALKSSNISINTTVNCLNIFYLEQIQSWIETHFSKENIEWHTPLCSGVMALDALPLDAIEYLKTKINRFNIPNSSNERAITAFVDYLKFWDDKRKLNWVETFPVSAQYYEKYLT